MIQRDMFQRRLAENKPISVHEFLYPLLQGYDSVALEIDGELGGTDQTFNMLAGRTLMHALQAKREDRLRRRRCSRAPTADKMSKSFGNVIGVADPPVRDVRADHVGHRRAAAALLRDVHRPRRRRARRGPPRCWPCGVNPMTLKKRLARTITALPRDDGGAAGRGALRARGPAARDARGDAGRRLSAAATGRSSTCWSRPRLAASKSEARRLVEGGAVHGSTIRSIRDPRATVGCGRGCRAGRQAGLRAARGEQRGLISPRAGV